eukprot:169115-Pyramimonas_sp.AAC.1
MSWSTTQLNKAAIRAWHMCRGLDCMFDSCWGQRAYHFWRGLKKRARHDSHQKKAISIDELASFIQARLTAGSIAGARDAAFAAF